jgi:diguanylate cyclase (GGDEF)-like protein
MLGEEHVIIIMPTLLTMAFAGIAGLVCADKTLLIHYLTHGVVIVYTILMLLRLERGHAQFLGVATLALMFACLAASGPHHLAIKLQSATFYTAVMFALLHAKQVQNRYRYRLFLMSTRDELRKAAAIRRNDELSSIAYMDPLTAIPNRRYFEEICASISDTTKALLPLTLVLIDVDYFKNLNDHLGHLQGDRCLRVIATAIRNNLRGNADILARYGGEEFVLLLPGTDSHGAFEVVERIRIAVMSLNHPNPGTPSEIVTVSAGIAVAATRPVSTETLLGSADLALYRAKSTGRNRVCLQTPAS